VTGPCALILGLALGGGDDPAVAHLYDTRTFEETTIPAVADSICRRDVVFFGELHNSKDAHADELALLKELYERRKDLILSFEMFERDRQGVLDDYLAGRLDEARFRAQARPWPNYADYKPLIEFAKEHGLPVVASCIPWKTAVQFGKEGGEPPRGPWVARDWSSPADDYRARFAKSMQNHMKKDDTQATMERMYRSQCLRDDTMAEAIADEWLRYQHRHPLILHFCGTFHSDFGQGTVERVVSRIPSISVGIVSTIQPEPEDHFVLHDQRDRADYLLVVPSDAAKKKAEEPKAAQGDVKGPTPKSPAPNPAAEKKPAAENRPAAVSGGSGGGGARG
jgi:uncharacterized iron-regulated protein